MWGALSLRAITSRLKNFPMSPAAAPKQIFLPRVQRTALFLLCSVDAVWVPGACLQLLSQPSLKCEKPVFESTGMEFSLEFSKDCYRLQDYDCYRVVLLHFDIMKQAKKLQARQNTAASPANSTHENCLYFRVIRLKICPKPDCICKTTSVVLG